ncbi:Na+/H+ antiporter [Cohnella zeiphila]|uniref:Na+/H+ antiporter n=1 Tax=Cohnella zeiphila TaxID=2761120 RepID=A0A7X0SND6_9BACL|nr:Na+/H+ antiporter [Cohnella zeiphila]MBB6733084.1 Na+/H+ antiporter [Cohnella zeiphila]
MELFLIVLGLLALIALSNVLNRIVPAVPVPLFQIALGAVLAANPFGIHMEFDPELFFVLFVAPLLFNDGRRTPRDELWQLRGSILLLAVGLVFATVLIGGYAIHGMIPTIPLSAAFALAAILSPTDAVAVSSLAGRIRLPEGILRLLEGEALMNDASGLVAFKFAVAATVTGIFSLPRASLSFVLIAVGGLLAGVVLSALIIVLRTFLRRLGIEDVTMHVLIQILTPFVIYLLAEEAGVSGVLAVVAGGIFHAVAKDRMEPYATKLQVVSASTWSVLLFVLNGLVFLLLGLQIPDVAAVIFRSPDFNNYQAIGYIVVITLLLYALRFVWVFLFSALAREGKTGRQRFKISLLTTLSGVRGAVTLAGAFSIPLWLNNGSPFPVRDLILFLSAGVILLTLLAASVVLPLLSGRAGPAAESKHLSEHEAQMRILSRTVAALREEIDEDNKEVVQAVIGDYNRKLNQIRMQAGGIGPEWREAMREIWMEALKAEREELGGLVRAGLAGGEPAGMLEAQLSRTESLLAGGRVRMLARTAKIAARRLRRKLKGTRPMADGYAEREQIRRLKVQTCKAALKKLGEETDNSRKESALPVIVQYQEIVERLSHDLGAPHRREEFDRCKKEYERKAIQMERDALQSMYEAGEVSYGMMNGLRFFINTMEASVTEEVLED